MIFSRDIISSIFIYKKNFIYVANKTKNCIQLYHTSGLPLNIFTREFGNDYLHGLNAIDNPSKIYIDQNDLLYICNYNHNVTLFDLNRHLCQIAFYTKSPSDEYLDTSLLHLNPIDICVKVDERIFVLYKNPHKIGIYNYQGEKIHRIEFNQNQLTSQLQFNHVSISIEPQFIHYHNSYLYLYNSIDQSYIKYDKNGIITNFDNDEYGHKRFKVGDNIIYSQLIHTDSLLFTINHRHQINIYDLSGNKVEHNFTHNIQTVQPSSYFDIESSIFYYYDKQYIQSIQEETETETKSIISYDPQSNYVPTTNIEVIQFLASKKSIYKKIIDGYRLSNQYLNENKEYILYYYDYISKQNYKIPSYELIFILQSKFLMDQNQYKNDPFIQKYPQHFLVYSQQYTHYQSKRKLHLAILQSYKEALLYQKLCDDLHKILTYDDYLNLTDNIKLIFHIQDPYLFPRLHNSQSKGIYNKKQCVILNQSLFI